MHNWTVSCIYFRIYYAMNTNALIHRCSPWKLLDDKTWLEALDQQTLTPLKPKRRVKSEAQKFLFIATFCKVHVLVMLTYFNDVKIRDFTGHEINLQCLIQVKDFKLSFSHCWCQWFPLNLLSKFFDFSSLMRRDGLPT